MSEPPPRPPRARARRLGAWQPVRRLDVAYQDDGAPTRVGGLAADDRGRVYFQYDAGWLARGVELAPHELPTTLGTELRPAPGAKALHGLHGVFADSLPDSWGMRVLDRAFRRAGVAPDRAGPLDRLAWLGTRTMGALTYHPALGAPDDADRAISLDALSAEADALAAGPYAAPAGVPADPAVLDALERAAGSAGGAQPKVLVALSPDGARPVAGPDAPSGYVPYLVKFTPARDELGLPADGGALEEAYARMARDAGVPIPPSRLLATSDGRRHFAVERFDRTPRGEGRPGGRRHVLTLGGLLGRAAADGGDYDELLRWTRALTGDAREVEAGVRRLWFNLRALNDDDHPKNVAFRFDPADGWALAPAYDLTYAPGRGGARGMSVDGREGDVTWATVAQLAARHGVRPARLADLRAQVDAAVDRWEAHAAAAQVPPASAVELAQAFGERRARLDRARLM